jgi:hypothetical protein
MRTLRFHRILVTHPRMVTRLQLRPNRSRTVARVALGRQREAMKVHDKTHS